MTSEFKVGTVTDIFQSLAESWLDLSDEERGRYVREAERTNPGQQRQVSEDQSVEIVLHFIFHPGGLTRLVRRVFTAGDH